MKFTIIWYEYHNPLNWGKTEKEGINNILDSFPWDSWQYDGDDGWIEVSCKETFTAEDIEKAKEYVRNNYEVDIFSVFANGEYSDAIFTEENL